MEGKKEIVDQGAVGFVESMPRYRVNAKQLASGYWEMDITVELRTPTAEWPDPARPSGTSPKTATEIWRLLCEQLRNEIVQSGGKLVEKAPPKGAKA